MKIIVAGPYIGELGFEIGNWVPHLASIRNDYDFMVVFARNDHKDLYPFADEFIGFDFGLETKHCDKNWMMKPTSAEVEKYHGLEKKVVDHARSLTKAGHVVSLYLSDQKIRRMSFIERIPVVLPGDDEKRAKWKQVLPVGPNVILVVRSYSRGSSKNTDPKLLDQIIRELKNEVDVNCILVGSEELPFKCETRNKCTDLLGKTSIDDLVAIYSMADVVVGASTGTIHLAAACGVPHITWVTWVGDVPTIKNRYLSHWNLNQTPVNYLLGKQVSYGDVVNFVLNNLG